MIDTIELRTRALEDLLGKNDDRLSRLVNAEPRCLEQIPNPCGLCLVPGQIVRTQSLGSFRTAQEIANICCPNGKMPECLKRQLMVTAK